MSIFVALVGLAFLIFVHEAGHFFVARAVGMNPRKFYVGFPPALVKTKRNGIEYGIGAIPLGGYVKIPGMHRPAAGDVDQHFGRAIEEAPPLGRPLDDLRRHLDESDYDGRRVRAGARSRRTSRRGALAARPPLGRARSDGASRTHSARTRTGAHRRGSGSRPSSPGRPRTSSSPSSSSPRSSCR